MTKSLILDSHAAVDASGAAVYDDDEVLLTTPSQSIASPVQPVQYVGGTSPIPRRRGWPVLAWQFCEAETLCLFCVGCVIDQKTVETNNNAS